MRIRRGWRRIRDGPLCPLDEITFTYYPSGFVDKSSGLDARVLVEPVNEIIRTAQADGTLLDLSMEWFGARLHHGGGGLRP